MAPNMSSVHLPPDVSHQIPGSSFDERISFIIPPQLLEFDSSGAEFVGFDEIRIDIPPNAIPDKSTRYLEVGVCLYGPFEFEENYGPISPILWMCVRENTRLDKPITVIIPHTLSDISEEEYASFGVRFSKASHDCVTNDSGESVYKFQPLSDDASFYSSRGKSFGVLQTDSFCFMCLEARSSASHERALRLGYCLTCVVGPGTELRMFATYFLETCLIVSNVTHHHPLGRIIIMSKVKW